MPYRGTLEAVNARCQELAARVGELEGVPVRKRRGTNMGDALDLESRLQTRLVMLAACKFHEVELPGITTDPSVPAYFPSVAPLPPTKVSFAFRVVYGVLLLALVTAGFSWLAHR